MILSQGVGYIAADISMGAGTLLLSLAYKSVVASQILPIKQ